MIMKKHSEELFQIGEVTKIIGITRKALSGSIPIR